VNEPLPATAPAPAGTSFVRRRAPTLWIIIGLKLGKAGLLLLLAAVSFSLIDRDAGALFDAALRWIKVDPALPFFAKLGDHLEKITPANWKWLASGSLLYAMLLLVEGGGLIRRSGWAVWLAIGETAFFIPFEVFDMLEHFTWRMGGVLLLNLVIVAYLIVNRDRLFRHHHPRPRS
jgi:uncharacterized membrane protein (DUF2068 family)